MKTEQELEALQLIEQLSSLPNHITFWYEAPGRYTSENAPIGNLLKPKMTRQEIAEFEAVTGIKTSVMTWSHENPDENGNPPVSMLKVLEMVTPTAYSFTKL